MDIIWICAWGESFEFIVPVMPHHPVGQFSRKYVNISWKRRNFAYFDMWKFRYILHIFSNITIEIFSKFCKCILLYRNNAPWLQSNYSTLPIAQNIAIATIQNNNTEHIFSSQFGFKFANYQSNTITITWFVYVATLELHSVHRHAIICS